MATLTYRFDYISLGIQRGTYEFDLYYIEGKRKLVLHGEEPPQYGEKTRINWPPYLDFPTEESWPTKAPGWSPNERSVVRSRLLEWAKTTPRFQWITADNLTRPPPPPPPTPEQIAWSKAYCESAAKQMQGFRDQQEARAERTRKSKITRQVLMKILLVVVVIYVLVQLMPKNG